MTLNSPLIVKCAPMIATHTHVHFKSPTEDGAAEALLLTLMVSTDGTVDEIAFENAYFLQFEQAEAAKFSAIRAGAEEALHSSGHTNATVAVLDIGFLKAAPHSLFAEVAKTCVEQALTNPTEAFSYTGRKAHVEKWKAAHDAKRGARIPSGWPPQLNWEPPF